jgi:hypothetical protein
MKGSITTTPAKPRHAPNTGTFRVVCLRESHTRGSCDECSNNPEKEIQRSRAGVSSGSAGSSNRQRGTPIGRPSVGGVRSKRNGEYFDFSSVRVHTETRAAESAAALNARAYTSGDEIVCGAGYYAPKRVA